MLGGSNEKECTCYEPYAPEIFDKFFEKGLIELLGSKRPEEIEKTNDPEYCKYLIIIYHRMEKCKAFKGKVL